MPQKITC